MFLQIINAKDKTKKSFAKYFTLVSCHLNSLIHLSQLLKNVQGFLFQRFKYMLGFNHLNQTVSQLN